MNPAFYESIDNYPQQSPSKTSTHCVISLVKLRTFCYSLIDNDSCVSTEKAVFRSSSIHCSLEGDEIPVKDSDLSRNTYRSRRDTESPHVPEISRSAQNPMNSQHIIIASDLRSGKRLQFK